LLAVACGQPPPQVRDLVELFSAARSQAAPGLIDLGTPDARRFLGSGWSSDEGIPGIGTYVWAVGASSEVDIFVPAVRDLPLTFRCWPFVFPESPAQHVTIVLNGATVAKTALRPEPSDYRVDLPAAGLREGWNHLVLHYAYARAPIEVAASPDDRPLAVAWDFIRVGEDDAVPKTSPSVDTARRQLVVPLGASVAYDLRVPPGAAFEFDRLEFEGDADGVLRVRLEADGRGHEVIARFGGDSEGRSVAFPPKWADIVRLSIEAVPGDAGALASADVRIHGPRLRLPGEDPPRGPARAKARPNVLVYLVDTLRADRLGCYGNERPTSPTVDAMTHEAILFADVVAESTWTRPSTASLFTGLSPRQHAAVGRADVLPDAAITMAELFREAGYETAAFVTNGNVAPIFGFAQGFDVFELLPGTIVPSPDGAVPSTLLEAPSSPDAHAVALQWLADRNPDRPFFLYVHTADPHSPYLPSREFRERIGVPDGIEDLGSLTMMTALHERRLVADASLTRALLLAYEAEIAYNDHELGVFRAELERRGLWDDALVVFVSDHGEEFLEHGGWEHGRSVYTEATQVPLILKLPEGAHAGTRVDRTVQLADVLPTLVEHLGLRRPEGLTGTSLLARLDPAAPPRAAFSHVDLDGHLADTIVEGRWKLVRTRHQVELYDRIADPRERASLAPSHSVTIDYLTTRLAARLAQGAPHPTPQRATMTGEVERNLRALGYVQ
jgi:arylsulfatase A-like enzyme